MKEAVIKAIIGYLETVDDSISLLSKHSEGRIVNLPSWVLHKKTVNIGITSDFNTVIIKVSPDDKLEQSVLTCKTVKNKKEIDEIISPMILQAKHPYHFNTFLILSDLNITSGTNPLSVPILDNKFLIGAGHIDHYFKMFSQDKAKQDAINLWNIAKNKNINRNYVRELRNIFDKFNAIIKRKSYKERRIHRYINEHHNFLLPQHKKCYYEHIIKFNGEYRKADFILERESGLPPILIELESPAHRVFTKKFDFTKEANHAKTQIDEWIQFLDSDPANNASGHLEFLKGPKEKMVIIGKGLEYKDRLINTKFGGVVFWTYSLMLEEARNRANNIYAFQCKTIGMEAATPF